MNKTTLTLALLLLVIGNTKAQSYAALENYSFGWYIQYMENLVELQNGDILTSTRLFNMDSNGHFTNEYGYCFLKLSRDDASILDSVFLPDNYTNFHLLEPHPSGDGYLFINQVYDSLTGSNFMKIRHFHDDLAFDDEIRVPLTDTVYGGMDLFLLEEDSFLMVSYDGHGSHTIQRFGLDGTLMDRAVYSSSDLNFEVSLGIKIWSRSHREYVLWGYTPGSNPSFCYNVLDSLLNIKETIALEQTPQYPNIWFEHRNRNTVESLDETTYLLATPYKKTLVDGSQQFGVQVTERDKATHTNQKTVFFPLKVQTSGNSSYVIDVKQTEEGNIYLAYGDLSGANKLSVVLMDAELNTLWQQYYLDLDEWDSAKCMKLLNDESVGIVGDNNSMPKVFALFVNNDYDTLEEQGFIVRPYDYYPNPIQDELHLQFSPDVTPTQIELYDMQGRLVKTQRNGLENLNLEELSAGAYTMRVTLENGKVFSEKVVKE